MGRDEFKLKIQAKTQFFKSKFNLFRLKKNLKARKNESSRDPAFLPIFVKPFAFSCVTHGGRNAGSMVLFSGL